MGRRNPKPSVPDRKPKAQDESVARGIYTGARPVTADQQHEAATAVALVQEAFGIPPLKPVRPGSLESYLAYPQPTLTALEACEAFLARFKAAVLAEAKAKASAPVAQRKHYEVRVNGAWEPLHILNAVGLRALRKAKAIPSRTFLERHGVNCTGCLAAAPELISRKPHRPRAKG
jgi:hypothetical protein